MKTAFEMADFVIGHETGPEAGLFTGTMKADVKRRQKLAEMFRPIERVLADVSGEAVYALTSYGMDHMPTTEELEKRQKKFKDWENGLHNPFRFVPPGEKRRPSREDMVNFQWIQGPKSRKESNVAVVFACDRLIMSYVSVATGACTKTVFYSDVCEVNIGEEYETTEGLAGPKTRLLSKCLSVGLNDGTTLMFSSSAEFLKGQCLYRQFQPDDAYRAVKEVIAGLCSGQQQQDGVAVHASSETGVPAGVQAVPDVDIDALKKLKDLVDMGVLTQEEFEAKKTKILGI